MAVILRDKIKSKLIPSGFPRNGTLQGQIEQYKKLNHTDKFDFASVTLVVCCNIKVFLTNDMHHTGFVYDLEPIDVKTDPPSFHFTPFGHLNPSLQALSTDPEP
jgi:hypothetical protein